MDVLAALAGAGAWLLGGLAAAAAVGFVLGLASRMGARKKDR